MSELGKIGAKARKDSLTAEERSKIASDASNTRWNAARSLKDKPDEA